MIYEIGQGRPVLFNQRPSISKHILMHSFVLYSAHRDPKPQPGKTTTVTRLASRQVLSPCLTVLHSFHSASRRVPGTIPPCPTAIIALYIQASSNTEHPTLSSPLCCQLIGVVSHQLPPRPPLQIFSFQIIRRMFQKPDPSDYLKVRAIALRQYPLLKNEISGRSH